MSSMASVVPDGKCALTVAARQTLSEARDFVANDLGANHRPYVRIARSQNGWYAISVGDIPKDQFETIKSRLVAKGEIPADSYCSNGKKYVEIIDDPNTSIGERLTVKSSDGELNIRSGPSTDNQIVDVVYNGDTVLPSEAQGNWVYVTTSSGVKGWAYRPLLVSEEEIARANQPSQSSGASSNSDPVRINGGGLLGDLLGATLDIAATVSGSDIEVESVLDDIDIDPISSQDSYCYSIDNDDSRYACLEEPYSTNNDDARNILLGNCYALSNWASDFGLGYVCSQGGQDSCYALNDSDIAYACSSCGGTRRWAATAATGHIFECF